MNDKNIKAINFDLDTIKLKENFLGKHYDTKAYADIKRFFTQNGFKHRQGSGYISKKPITDTKVIKTIDKLVTTYPYLKESVKKFDVTNIGATYDLSDLFKNDNKSKQLLHSAPDKTDTMEYYEAEINKAKP